MNISFLHSRRGQTLVEALVALSILTTGFIGIVALLAKSFQLNRTTADDTQATYLAAEGIEIVKNLSDHDIYSGLPGNDYFGQCFYDGSGYYYPIDYETVSCNPASLDFQTTPPNTPIYFDPTTHLFGEEAAGGTPTDFVRNIEVINNGEELDVRSTVTWTDGGLSDTITLEDHFYNSHP